MLFNFLLPSVFKETAVKSEEWGREIELTSAPIN
jgi:hypothetical protein